MQIWFYKLHNKHMYFIITHFYQTYSIKLIMKVQLLNIHCCINNIFLQDIVSVKEVEGGKIVALQLEYCGDIILEISNL